MLKCLSKTQFLPFAIFAIIGIFGYTLPSIDYFSAIPGDLGDARLNSVILEHLFRWVTGQENSLWSPSFFFPFEGVLAFSDNHFGSAASYIFLRLLGLGREVAFDGWLLIGNCLNFIAAYVVMRRMGLKGFASAAGAFVFAFSLAVLPKEGHAQLTYRFAIPFAFLALWELLTTKRLYLLWRVFFWCAIQIYCSIYLGIFLLYLLSAMLIPFLIWNRDGSLFNGLISSLRMEKKSSLFFATTSIALISIAVFWLLLKYHAVDLDYKPGPWRFNQIPEMLPRLSSYLLADRSFLYQWSGKFINGIPFRHEHQMFFGFGVWVLGVSGVLASWRGYHQQNLGKVATLSIVILIALTLSVHGHSLYSLISFLPGISQIRAVSRVVLVILFPVAILVAIGSEHLLSICKDSPKLKKVSVLGIIIFMVTAETLSYQPRNAQINLWYERETALKEKLPINMPSSAILYVSKKESEPFYLAELDAMILAQDFDIKTLNGYSGSFPPGYMEPEPCYSYLNRLNGYAEHRRATPDQMELMASKVIIVAYTSCGQNAVIASSTPITSEQVKKIFLNVKDVEVGHQSLSASIIVTNSSSKYLNTTSSKGAPIRLSWRFVNVSSTGSRLDDPGFVGRKNLLWSLAPATSYQTNLHVELPTKPGNYLFEVSLVQDGVAWFHDLGMSIIGYLIVVDDERSSLPVSAYQAKNIKLEFTGVQISDGLIAANLNVRNVSKLTFNSVPVRYSWRFVALSPSGKRVSEPGWDERKDLEWPVESNSSKKTKIVAKLPSEKGVYYFEVTLVQDGVAWLHDLGMPVASTQISVK